MFVAEKISQEILNFDSIVVEYRVIDAERPNKSGFPVFYSHQVNVSINDPESKTVEEIKQIIEQTWLADAQTKINKYEILWSAQ